MISQTDLFHPLLLIGQGGKSARVFSTHLNKIRMAAEADSKAKSPKCPSTTRSRCVLTCFGQRCTCLLVWPKGKRTFAPSWLAGGKACPKPLWWARPCAQGAYGGYAPRAEPHIFLLCKWLLGLCQHLFWWLSAFAQASWWSPKWWFLCSRYWPACRIPLLRWNTCSLDTFSWRSSSNVPRLPSFLKCDKETSRFSCFWQVQMSKAHAVVVRSTCRSKHVKNTACSDHFWTFNWQKWSETFSLSISNSKCASHHFLNIWTSKSAPTLRCFVHFDFDMCFALQRRALFEHQLPKMPRAWSALCIFTSKYAWRHNGVRFFISHPTRWLCPWRLCRLQRAYFSTLRSHKTLEKKQYFTTFLLFRAPWSSLFWLFLFSDFFSSDYFSSLPLPTSASSVHVVGSLTSFSDLTCTMFSCFLPKCCCRVALCDFQFYLRFSWLISASCQILKTNVSLGVPAALGANGQAFKAALCFWNQF